MKSFQQHLTESSLKDHVHQIAGYTKAPKGIRPPSVLLRDYGQVFDFGPDSFEGPRAQAKMCYRNAGRLAIGSSEYTYCEGYVDVLGIPVAHAWCINREGRVVDPTLTPKGIRGFYGIAIKERYLTRTMMKTKVWGVLDVMSNRDILTDDPKDIVA